MRIFFALGVGVFLYGVFFGGDGSKKKFHIPFLGCIDPSDPDLFFVPGNQKLHGLGVDRRFIAREKFNGVVGDFLLDVLSRWISGSKYVVADAGDNAAGGHELNVNTDTSTRDGECCN